MRTYQYTVKIATASLVSTKVPENKANRGWDHRGHPRHFPSSLPSCIAGSLDVRVSRSSCSCRRRHLLVHIVDISARGPTDRVIRMKGLVIRWSHLTLTQLAARRLYGLVGRTIVPARECLLLPVRACFISKFRGRHPDLVCMLCDFDSRIDGLIARVSSSLGEVHRYITEAEALDLRLPVPHKGQL